MASPWNRVEDFGSATTFRNKPPSLFRAGLWGLFGISSGATSILGVYNWRSVFKFLPEEISSWKLYGCLDFATTAGVILVLTMAVSGYVSFFRCLKAFGASVSRRSILGWASGLQPKKRQLLGMPEGPPSTPVQPSAKKPPLPTPSPPLGPPLRGHRIPASPLSGTPDSGLGASGWGAYRAQTVSPGGRSGAAGSPYQRGSPTARVVSTEEQLKPFLDRFDENAAATSAAAAADGAGDGGYPPSFPFGASTLQPGMSLGMPEAPPLPMGPEAPLYRPSIRGSIKTGGVVAGVDSGRASSVENFERVLRELQTDRRTLEEWTERFREWLSSEVLKPLLKAMADLHTQVSSGLQSVQPGFNQAIPPIGEGDASIDNLMKDAFVWLEGNIAQAQKPPAMFGQQPGVPKEKLPELQACLKLVKQYQGLAAVLKGQRPKGLLQTVSQGYVASRLRQLAEGSCLKEFSWDSGGDWAGKPWSSELPSDSALMLFLFGAYLEAPRWEYDGETAGGLYLGMVEGNFEENATGILLVRPRDLKKMLAVLGLSLASQDAHFVLVRQGEASLTLTGHSAFFYSILLFLQHAKLHPQEGRMHVAAPVASVGGRTLPYLKLDAVLAPALPYYSVFTKWFSFW